MHIRADEFKSLLLRGLIRAGRDGDRLDATVDSSRATLSLSGRIVIMKTSNNARLIDRRDPNHDSDYNFHAYAWILHSEYLITDVTQINIPETSKSPFIYRSIRILTLKSISPFNVAINFLLDSSSNPRIVIPSMSRVYMYVYRMYT